nr:elongator complex protein 4 [Quercus suber]
MSFRKRTTTLGPGKVTIDESAPRSLPGIRPSPLSSHPTTSTGTATLDGLLGGHSGLILGSILLIEESGTTDFAGVLLRFYAAEGLCQGHVIHTIGVGNEWTRELPDIAEEKSSRSAAMKSADADEKMRIAWRYERLGPAGERGLALPDRSLPSRAGSMAQEPPFCHTFDLTKRLPIPPDAKIHHIPISPSASNPFLSVINALTSILISSSPNSVHRVVIPTILSPALWPPPACLPQNFLSFLHSLRFLLRKYSDRLTILTTLPLELYTRSSGLVRFAETLSDGVLELTPFPHLMDSSHPHNQYSSQDRDEHPQGMLKVHKIPLSTERGEGGAGAGNSLGEDLAFTVSRRKFVIKPFALPPMEGDEEAQGKGPGIAAKDVEF